MNILNRIILAAIAVTGFFACTKTEDLPARSQSNILSFSVANLPDTLIYGAIDQTDKTITIYLPFYYDIPVIDPAIKLQDGARIDEEIIPFSVNDTARYIVKGKDGSTTYKAFVSIQAPGVPLTLMERTSPDEMAEVQPGYTQFWFGGSFFTGNPALIKAWLVNEKTQAETEIKGGYVIIDTDASTGRTMYVLSNIVIPPTMDSGFYKLKASTFGRFATTENPIHISYAQPEFGYFTTRTVKQGETFFLNAQVQQGKVFTDIKTFAISTNGTDWFPLTVEKYNRTEATIRVPENVPPGEYNRYRMEFNHWNTIVRSGSYTTITAK